MGNPKTILVAPLDWGLGHATRCIPLIRSFLDHQHKVIIATSGKQEALLKEEFPDLEFLHLPGYKVEYPKDGSMAMKMLWQLPKIKKAIEEEHDWLEEVLKNYKIDEVVSDNRYGLWNAKVRSVLVTHQLFIKAPTGEWLLEKILNSYLDHFNEVWIPDTEGFDNLSGDLSHKKSLPDHYQFIGPLSRFFNKKCHPERSRRVDQFEYDFMAILSGPEPQRTIFEEMILKQVEGTRLKGVLVRGLPDENSEFRILNSELSVFNHLGTSEFLDYLQKSKVVISRSGYSTIMDLAVLGKQAILVPTPGQTEQEYLAQYHQEKGHFYTQKQSEFDLGKGLKNIS